MPFKKQIIQNYLHNLLPFILLWQCVPSGPGIAIGTFGGTWSDNYPTPKQGKMRAALLLWRFPTNHYCSGGGGDSVWKKNTESNLRICSEECQIIEIIEEFKKHLFLRHGGLAKIILASLQQFLPFQRRLTSKSSPGPLFNLEWTFRLSPYPEMRILRGRYS